MPLKEPVTLGPFLVGPDGRISLRDPSRPPSFTFRWRDRPMHARLHAAGEDQVAITVQATLGRVPSTADGAPGSRAHSFRMLRTAGAAMAPDWQVGLTPDHRVAMMATRRMTGPVSAVGMLGEITGVLLNLGPYLDALEEHGLPRPTSH